jgi:IS5 family transposase
MAFYMIRSERMFSEQLSYNLLFKWFLDMDMHEPAFDPTSFGKNRERPLEHDVAGHFFRAVVEQARTAGLMSSEHFSVDGDGLIAAMDVAKATGFAERSSALAMLDRDLPRRRRRTLGADAGYDTADFVAACRARRISPHVAQNRSRRRSAIDGRTTTATGYGVSISLRRMIERIFGWRKTTANFRCTRLRGLAKTAMLGMFVGAACNILRLVRLTAAAA